MNVLVSAAQSAKPMSVGEMAGFAFSVAGFILLIALVASGALNRMAARIVIRMSRMTRSR